MNQLNEAVKALHEIDLESGKRRTDYFRSKQKHERRYGTDHRSAQS